MNPTLSHQTTIIICILILLLIIRRRRRRRRRRRALQLENRRRPTLPTSSRRRSVWVRSWVADRDRFGCYLALQRELELADNTFRRNFPRMDTESFEELLQKVTPHIERSSTHMRLPIPPAERLSVTLRYLASGNKYLDLEWLYNIPQSSLSNIIPETCQAIYDVLKNDYLKVPNTDQWRAIADGFKTKWDFPNCIGALGAKHIRMQPPPATLLSGQKKFSTVLFTLVDIDYKFLYVEVGWNGSVGDDAVFQQSSLKHYFENDTFNIPLPQCLHDGRQEVPFVAVADDAFPLTPNIMTPANPSNGDFDLSEQSYNYRLSRAHQVSENAFGILTDRFKIYDNPITLAPYKVDKIVKATCALHNFLLTKSGARVVYTPPGSLDCESDDHDMIKGDWRDQSAPPRGVANMTQQVGDGEADDNGAKLIWEEFMRYFNNEGAVSWQTKRLDQ